MAMREDTARLVPRAVRKTGNGPSGIEAAAGHGAKMAPGSPAGSAINHVRDALERAHQLSYRVLALCGDVTGQNPSWPTEGATATVPHGVLPTLYASAMSANDTMGQAEAALADLAKEFA